ncbi:MAG: hypothetical protein AAFP98_06015 [Pseudomonadota bacterium]
MTYFPMITTAFLFVAGAAAAETNWTWTGPNGGVTNGTTQCDRPALNHARCNSSGVFTRPNGRATQWNQERTVTDGTITGRRTAIGPNGRERAVTWTRVRQR